MKNVLGIVFSNVHDHAIGELTAHRCMGSIPVGGRYRLIDFALSNLANSGIEDVGVITKSNFQSLMDHLGNGREWDLSHKRGGLVILPPFGRAEAGGMYRGRIEALAGVMGYIKKSPAKYVLAADCDMMANIDLSGFIESHVASGADISVMYKRMNMDNSSAKDCTSFVLDADGGVVDMLIQSEAHGEQNAFINIMLLSKSLLERLVNEAYSRNRFSFGRDILQAGIGRLDIRAYEFTGYASRFDCLRSYFDANMALLDSVVREQLFPRERPIYTKLRDEAPTRYGLNASVRNSLLADGCIIEGEVENSVLFRGVTVGKGVKVKNSILMQGTRVGQYSNLDCVITDKDVTINDSRMIMGFTTYPVFIAKGSSV